VIVSITVLLVDDNLLFRGGIAQILRADGRFNVVGQAASGEEAVAVAARLKPALILIDLRMPGMNGVEAIRRIRLDSPDVPIGVLTMFETDDYIQSALAAGASGYLAKDSTPADLREAAVELAGGRRDLVAVPKARRSGADAHRSSPILARLTVREVEVLRALATGASNEVIAASLGISPKTLRNHIRNTYRKLEIHDRAQAVIAALREGLVQVLR